MRGYVQFNKYIHTYIHSVVEPYACSHAIVVVVVVFTLKTVLTSIQYLLFLTLQGKETNFRGHKLTQNKVKK